jgi:thioredoxin 1
MASELLLHIGDDNFDEIILKTDMPTLVDFWAPWCGPCRAIGPILEDLAEQYHDKIKVVKVNIDDYKQKATEYGVMSIPTLILFKEGKVVDTLVGVVPKERLEMFISKAL